MNVLVDLAAQLLVAAATVALVVAAAAAAGLAWERWAARNGIVWRPTDGCWVTDRRGTLDAQRERRP